jgi:hypothetical protein
MDHTPTTSARIGREAAQIVLWVQVLTGIELDDDWALHVLDASA